MRGIALALAACAPQAILGLTADATAILSGLANPRGITFGSDGSLYVAEAGTAGPENAATCLTSPPPQNARQCYGATGAITRLWPAKNKKEAHHERIVTGLPSVGDPSGVGAIGVADLGFQGGSLYAVIGYDGDATKRNLNGLAALKMASLVQITGKKWKNVADLGAYEIKNNPDGGVLESDPFGLLVEGNVKIVVDAAANALLKVLPNGQVSTLGVFPKRLHTDPAMPQLRDSVPTSVLKGPDGAYYVSELTGFPFSGSSIIWRVSSGSTVPVAYRTTSLKLVTDIAFGPNGDLYALEYAAGFGLTGFTGAGRIVKVNSDNTLTEIYTGLVNPTSLYIDRSGVFYVSNKGSSPTAGEVLKIVVSP